MTREPILSPEAEAERRVMLKLGEARNALEAARTAARRAGYGNQFQAALEETVISVNHVQGMLK